MHGTRNHFNVYIHVHPESIIEGGILSKVHKAVLRIDGASIFLDDESIERVAIALFEARELLRATARPAKPRTV